MSNQELEDLKAPIEQREGFKLRNSQANEMKQADLKTVARRDLIIRL